MNSIVARAFEAYGVQSAIILDPQTGYRNTSYATQLADGSMVNLIIYKNESGIQDRIARSNKVGNFLSSHDLPSRSAYDDRILVMKSTNGKRYASLYEYLPGETIPWEGYTKHHIKLLGAAMGYIHGLTVALQQSVDSPTVVNEYTAICNRMQRYFTDKGVINATLAKLNLKPLDGAIIDDFLILLSASQKLPNQRMLHMDLVRGNVLYQRPTGDNALLQDGPVELCGILDFEKTAYGHPVYDLARTFAFLLVDCKYKTADKIEKYFLRSGYAKRGKGAIPEIHYKLSKGRVDVLYELTSMFLLYDFYKFLRHNPYESLADNEHFVRTRDILLDRKVLCTV